MVKFSMSAQMKPAGMREVHYFERTGDQASPGMVLVMTMGTERLDFENKIT